MLRMSGHWRTPSVIHLWNHKIELIWMMMGMLETEVMWGMSGMLEMLGMLRFQECLDRHQVLWQPWADWNDVEQRRLGRFAQTCIDSRKLAQIRTNSRRFAQSRVDKFAQTRVDLHRLAWIYADSHKFAQTCTDSVILAQICSYSCRIVWIRTNSRRLM